MTRQRSKSTRQQIIDIAAKLVVAKGYEQVSFKELVEVSGISNGSIFYHFPTKDHLIEELFVRERKRYLGYVARCIIAHDGDPCAALGEGTRAAVLFQARQPRRQYRLVTQFTHSEWVASRQGLWDALKVEIEQPVIEWAMPHMAARKLPILPPATIQSMMIGPAELVFHQWREGRIPGPLADQAPILARFVTRGLEELRDAYGARATG
jgi:AcrR family transcriptional regulator